jgi:hypothetical protein
MPRKPLPDFVVPMQASSIKEPFDSPDWIFETKLTAFGQFQSLMHDCFAFKMKLGVEERCRRGDRKATLSEVEQWALREVRRPVLQESDRVEFKSQVTDPAKLARQIAGHSNSARSEWILWILGVDEKLGLVGIPGLEWAKLGRR